ncbi:hypothetical protein GCM10022408_29850 [Hymenobacter fastidiosus]|uniref:Uncharacterized protein n=1 Tax=Hymenobacter fastidiosus TaxID=486264 RepID=A0ABP7SPI8_9BACT
MEPIDVFSKITYLEEGMKKLLAEKAASSEEVQQLLAAVEAKAQPTITFDTEALAKHLAPLLAAQMPALNAAAVAKQLGPLISAGLPTSDTLRQAGSDTAARINKEFAQQEKRTLDFVGYLRGEMLVVKDQVEEIVDQMPKSVGLDIFRDKRILAMVLGTPIVCLLALIIYSSFFRVSKGQYEQLQQQSILLQQQRTLLKQQSDRMADAGIFYSNQIKGYKRKYPKSAGYFRDYRPMSLAQPVKSVAH